MSENKKYCLKHAVQRIALRGEDIGLWDVVSRKIECVDCKRFAAEENIRHNPLSKEAQ